jgi:ATP-dependent RNA helicase SUPV3L1/SUV3
MSDRPTGAAPSRLVAVLGPTNTGKTHLAVERMLGHGSGMIGLPLRLLAREIYDRVCKLKSPREVALITGEEKIVPPRPLYFICTVEAMPLGREVDFLAVDEIQLCTDPERGHIFTQRLLHARGRHETMLMGAATMAPLIRRLLPHAEIVTRDRFSALTYTGSKKLTRLPRRSAIVAFSADAVYGIAELIRRQRGGAAVVMGSLSPRTRNAQVALYQSGEVDFLVATDAIGMGLNMDVDHVAFAGLRKYDGKKTRWLRPQEVAQIGGRAGRFKRDGTFGVTGDAEEMDEDMVLAVEEHRFEPATAAEWRNAKLDLSSLPALLRSLEAPPQREGLKLAAESLDESVLRRMAEDADVVDRCRDRVALGKLWEVCQTPDFRKQTSDEHMRLVRFLFDELTGRSRRASDDWMAGQFKGLDRTDGEIDTLASRLAGVRTLAYVANRPDWLADANGWQGRTRGLEDRLSDILHEKLMARFIDRRTSVLMRQLGEKAEMLAGVADDGSVTVEGHYVGKLKGVGFEPARAANSLEEKALRGAAQRAVGPEVAKRLGRLAAEPDDAFAVSPDGVILWRGEATAALTGSGGKVRLYGDMGPPPARERAQRRLEAFVAAETGRRLYPLRRLELAISSGKLKGLPRGVAHRLLEAGGVLDRRGLDADLKALSQAERRALKSLGVRMGAFSLYLPALLRPEALAFAQALGGGEWKPPLDQLSLLPQAPPPSAAMLSARGLRAVGRYAAPAATLERLDDLLRANPQPGGVSLSDEARESLGWSGGEAEAILRALDYSPTAKPAPGQPLVWRRRPGAAAKPPSAQASAPHSPFAALAGFAVPPAAPEAASAARRPRQPRRRKPRQAQS